MAQRGDSSQVVYVDGDVPQLPIQLGQLLVDSSQISPGTTNLQQCTSQSPLVYEPIEGAYPISIRRFGAKVDGVSDDTLAIQEAIDSASATGGGTVFGWRGGTTLTTAPIIVKDNVSVDLEGGTIHAVLSSASDYGVRVRNHSALRNGTVTVTSLGSPGTQHGAHAPVLVGPLYGAGGTVASPSVDEGVYGWALQNLTLSSDKTVGNGAFAIQVNGGANNGLIDNITVPDSAVMFGGVGVDWGFLGTIDSADVPTSRTNFNAGTAYTTHPYNLRITNIKLGSLSRPLSGGPGTDTGSHGVRLSGVYNIKVENVRGAKTTECGVRFTAGDLGFEFAQAAVKPLAHTDVVFENCAFVSNGDGFLGLVDCYADNVAAAVAGSGYSPLLDPLAYTNLVVRSVSGVGESSGGTVAGIRANLIRGGTIEDCVATGFGVGALMEEQCFGTRLIRGRYYSNRDDGVRVEHTSRYPQDVVVDSPSCYNNGTNITVGTGAGVCIRGSLRTAVVGALLGNPVVASETAQIYGVRVASTSATEVTIKRCYAYSGKNAASTAYSLNSGTDYGCIKEFVENEWNASGGFSAGYGGVNLIPTGTLMGTDGALRRRLVGARAALSGDTTPTAGAWLNGDTVYYQDPTTANYIGTTCTAGGSPGTWKRFGATL